MVTKSEFSDWVQGTVTQDLFKTLLEQANFAVAEVINRSEVNVGKDQYLKGAVNTISQIMAWRPEFSDDVQPDAMKEVEREFGIQATNDELDEEV